MAAALAAGLAGCKSERNISVRVSVPGSDSQETPAAGVGIIALPYDRDSVLASLEARARTPKPRTAALDTLFARFRGPFTAYSRLAYAAGEIRDTLAMLREQLDSLPRGSPRQRSLATRVRRLSDSLAAIQARSSRARVQLDRARSEFLSRSESLSTAVRQWEDSTYQGWDSIVGNLVKSQGREASTDTTGATGWAHFTLPPGPWWLYAHAWDTSDPNAEWYWNVPVKEDTVLLSSRTGQRRPRY
jgi:hypothetical protein